MSVVQIEPTKDHPVPYDLAEEKPTTHIKEVEVAGNTAELQESLGAALEVTEEDADRAEIDAMWVEIGWFEEFGVFTVGTAVGINLDGLI